MSSTKRFLCLPVNKRFNLQPVREGVRVGGGGRVEEMEEPKEEMEEEMVDCSHLWGGLEAGDADHPHPTPLAPASC